MFVIIVAACPETNGWYTDAASHCGSRPGGIPGWPPMVIMRLPMVPDGLTIDRRLTDREGVVAALDADEAVTILDAAYRGVTEMLGSLAEADFLAPTLCLGWTVTDVLYHLLGDARRGLTAMMTPAGGAADTDFVSYWRSWPPDAGDAVARAGAWRLAAAAVIASTGPGWLVESWRETAPATVRLARLAPYPVVATQGHALTVADFAGTLVTEAAIHHLDMIAELPAAPGPAASCLALVRRVLDGLLGIPVPTEWDDTVYALKGTGRRPLTVADRGRLGELAGRFPLFG